jgi:hypothetical protein
MAKIRKILGPALGSSLNCNTDVGRIIHEHRERFG